MKLAFAKFPDDEKIKALEKVHNVRIKIFVQETGTPRVEITDEQGRTNLKFDVTVDGALNQANLDLEVPKVWNSLMEELRNLIVDNDESAKV